MAEPYMIRCEPEHCEWVFRALLVSSREMTFPVETLSLAEFRDRVYDVSSYYSYAVDSQCKALLWLGPVDPYVRAAEFGVIAMVRGEGWGQKATKALIDFGFGTIGLHRLFCTVNATNGRCLKSIEQFGFLKAEGRQRGARFLNGEFVDQLTFSILESDPR